MKHKIKNILMLTGLLLLSACLHDDDDSNDKASIDLNQVDLSGTWLHTRVDHVYSVQSNELLYTEYTRTTLLISDGESGVSYASCWEYDPAQSGSEAVKSGNDLYLDFPSMAYRAISANHLKTLAEQRVDERGPEYYAQRSVALEKLSDEVMLDGGNLSLQGAINVTQAQHVCLSHTFSNHNEVQIYQLIVPLDDGILELSMAALNKPGVGKIHYDPNAQPEGLIYSFQVDSNASVFWDTVGSNALGPISADIDIAISDDDQLSGSFSLLSFDSNAYTGSFQMDFSRQLAKPSVQTKTCLDCWL